LGERQQGRDLKGLPIKAALLAAVGNGDRIVAQLNADDASASQLVYATGGKPPDYINPGLQFFGFAGGL
jgi:hypothetical protein